MIARQVLRANSRPSTTARAESDDSVSMGKFVRNVDNAGYLATDKAECSWHVHVLLPRAMCYHGISPHCWSVKEAIVGLARANGTAGPGWVVVVVVLWAGAGGGGLSC
jgi:hypothetical protein